MTERKHQMSNLTIANITIKQDAEGRYCLNDFHKAAGGEKRHAPNEFMRRDSTTELVTELTGDSRFAPAITQRGGKTPGTYVCKELVYAYAMWVSPKFHLHVIRTYDRVVQEQLQAAKAEVQAVRQELLKQTKLTEYMTVQQYRAMTGVQWARKHNNAIGTFLANICRSRGYEIRQ